LHSAKYTADEFPFELRRPDNKNQINIIFEQKDHGYDGRKRWRFEQNR